MYLAISYTEIGRDTFFVHRATFSPPHRKIFRSAEEKVLERRGEKSVCEGVMEESYQIQKLWYWVVAVTSPWVAAQDAADGKTDSTDGAVLAKRFNGILAARGSKAARRRCERGYAALVEAYRQYKQVRYDCPEDTHVVVCILLRMFRILDFTI